MRRTSGAGRGQQAGERQPSMAEDTDSMNAGRLASPATMAAGVGFCRVPRLVQGSVMEVRGHEPARPTT